jgi:hypothetical protein
MFLRQFLIFRIADFAKGPVVDFSWLAESFCESLSPIQRRFKGGRTPSVTLVKKSAAPRWYRISTKSSRVYPVSSVTSISKLADYLKLM